METPNRILSLRNFFWTLLERLYRTGWDFGPLFLVAIAGRFAKARALPFFGTGHAPSFLCFAARFGMVLEPEVEAERCSGARDDQ